MANKPNGLKRFAKICKVENMRFMFGERVLSQPVGIPMGMNYAPLVDSLLLH